MTVIDHRILIPKSPETVWAYISDLTHNPNWQVDCRGVTVISTRRTGQGVRWRQATPSGREYIIEIAAWYEKLGYEYIFVDGAPFREAKGRIRLQEIAEGTIVQWTLTYEPGGVLGGLQNTLGLKRQFENAMIDSLRGLWKVIQSLPASEPARESKAILREGLDYEARAHYKPRFSSQKEPDAEAIAPAPLIPEPAFSDEDTRPRKPVVVEPAAVAPSVLTPVESSPVPEVAAVISPVVSEKPLENLPAAKYATQEAVAASTDEVQAVRATVEAGGIPVAVENPAPITATQEKVPVTESRSGDTAEVSVFDLFGVPRPSQTQQLQAVKMETRPVLSVEPVIETLADAVEVPVVQPVSAHPTVTLSAGRVGMRLVMRRKRVRVRRPGL